MKKIVCFFISATLLFSCAVKQPSGNLTSESQDYLLLSVLWFQKSAEMKALYYQGYNIAQKSLAEQLQKRDNKEPVAVVMDIDETIIDNSPSEAYQIIHNAPFSDLMWKNWVNISSAKTCPGALEFVKYAESQKVEVFYVTNRQMPDELQPTINNLKENGFPYADTLHLVLRNNTSSKESRRRALSEKYDIVLLIGDNLADFDTIFDSRAGDLGFGAVIKNREKFGREFIILPNPMYGPWINAAIKDMPGKTVREKMVKALEGF
jgi:5'-nucleotidase (lipoprotein e(P4) family)